MSPLTLSHQGGNKVHVSGSSPRSFVCSFLSHVVDQRFIDQLILTPLETRTSITFNVLQPDFIYLFLLSVATSWFLPDMRVSDSDNTSFHSVHFQAPQCGVNTVKASGQGFIISLLNYKCETSKAGFSIS